MPSSPLKLCAAPGCAARVSHRDRHCLVHTKQATREREARRPARVIDGEQTSGGGRKAFWRALREETLRRYPICSSCHSKASSHADHVIPKRSGGRDELTNLTGLCWGCHSRKTASEDGGFGNPRAKKRATEATR